MLREYVIHTSCSEVVRAAVVVGLRLQQGNYLTKCELGEALLSSWLGSDHTWPANRVICFLNR